LKAAPELPDRRARCNGPERVIAVDLGIVWEPNAPTAKLTATDGGETRLALRLWASTSELDRRGVGQHPDLWLGESQPCARAP